MYSLSSSKRDYKFAYIMLYIFKKEKDKETLNGGGKKGSVRQGCPIKLSPRMEMFYNLCCPVW